MSSVHTLEVENTGSCDHAATQLAITDKAEHLIQSSAQIEELVLLRNKTALLFAEGGPLNTVRYICDYLKKVRLGKHTFCDEKQAEYRFATDCGVLLCTNGLVDVLPDIDQDTANALEPYFEINWPWCRKDSWTWQKLLLPYSPSWAQDLDHLIGMAGELQQGMIQHKTGALPQSPVAWRKPGKEKFAFNLEHIHQGSTWSHA
ncbi:hypothetical protein LTR92_011499 [Exophiala xenobiotica]|nr:hypothetical protein LTR92_011499 [Exophiala xenobiotica]KAK5430774.1 hypothetical protein LTR18_011426 [Exophiala xenobiotica]KAK5463807.1 hypothetical protein LTR55_011800 [Exophiala xenobiotica]